MRDINNLIVAAQSARENAYVPYSQFSVGAAVLAGSGRVYTGCNIENASYGLTICAERTAIFNAVAAGERSIRAVAVIAATPGPVAPCGACRQVMAEFGVETISMANLNGEIEIVKMKELLPFAFASSDMGVIKE